MPVDSVASPTTTHSSSSPQKPPSRLIPSLELPDNEIETRIIPFLAPPQTDTFMPGYDEGKELANLARTNKSFRQFIQTYRQKNDGFYQKLTEALQWGTPLLQQFGVTLPLYLLPSSKRPQLSTALDNPKLLKYHRPSSELGGLIANIPTMQDEDAKASAIEALAPHPNLSTAQLDTLLAASNTLHKMNKASAIKALAKNPNLSTAQLDTLLDDIPTMQDEYYKAQAIAALAPHPNLSTTQWDTLLAASNTLQPFKLLAIRGLVKNPNLSTTQLNNLIDTINTMQDENAKDIAIRELSDNPNLSTAQLNNLIDTINTMQGERDKAKAIERLAPHPNLSPTQLDGLIDTINTMQVVSKDMAIKALKSRMFAVLDQLPTTT